MRIIKEGNIIKDVLFFEVLLKDPILRGLDIIIIPGFRLISYQDK